MPLAVSLEEKRLEVLTKRAGAGDRDAFGDLYDRFHTELLAYARRRVPTLEDAEDVVEHAFYKALRSIHKKDPRSPFNVWLFHITKNLITDFYRTQKVHEPIEDGLSTTASAEDEALRTCVGGRLDKAIAALTDRQRDVIRLRFMEGLEYPEIADRLGCGPGAVRVAQMRALRALRSALDTKPEAEEALRAS